MLSGPPSPESGRQHSDADSFLIALLVVGLVLATWVGLYVVRSGGEAVPAEEAVWVPGGDATIGETLIVRHGCGGCHVIPGIPAADGRVGPPLTQLGEQQFIAGQLANTPQNLVRWIVEPKHVAPGTAMPDLGLTEAEARHVAAYLLENN